MCCSDRTAQLGKSPGVQIHKLRYYFMASLILIASLWTFLVQLWVCCCDMTRTEYGILGKECPGHSVMQQCFIFLFLWHSSFCSFPVSNLVLSWFRNSELYNRESFFPLKVCCSAYVSCEFSLLWSYLCSWLGAGYHWRNSDVLLSLNFSICTF